MNSNANADRDTPADAPPPRTAATDEADDQWIGYESTHPLTWIPGTPVSAEPQSGAMSFVL